MKTVLKDRILWFDGSVEISPSNLDDLLHQINIKDVPKVCVTHESSDIKQYNKLAPPSERITTKSKLNDLDFYWDIPEKYKTMDLKQHIIDKLLQLPEITSLNDHEIHDRLNRINVEYRGYKKLKLLPLLRTLIYVINTFHKDGVVWGPGRGSSVSSYILYVIGVHDVDSVLYELDISDFLKHKD
jgi:DNA polymerase III alpha subunit